MIKILPPRFDDAGQEQPSDDNDPQAIWAELYVPDDVMAMDKTVIFEYKEKGIAAVRRVYFPDLRYVQDEQDADKGTTRVKRMVVDEVRDSALDDDGTTTSGLMKDLVKALKPSAARKEDEAKADQDLANLVFRDTDKNIPKYLPVTLTLSAPIAPAVLGFMKKDRRLTPSAWKKLREEHYNLSPDQLKALGPLHQLAGTPEDEAVMTALSPPLANALTALIKKNVDYHLVSFYFE